MKYRWYSVLLLLSLLYEGRYILQFFSDGSSLESKAKYKQAKRWTDFVQNAKVGETGTYENQRNDRYMGDIHNILAMLKSPNASLLPVSFGACCGIGHRLTRNIPTIVYASSQSRVVNANWHDIHWNVLFNDTEHVKAGHKTSEHYGNAIPRDWYGSSVPQRPKQQSTTYDQYDPSMKHIFDMPLGQAVVKSMRNSLSPLVMSFLSPLREQYSKSGLHMCTHVREGNNEMGDWANKKWRHLDLMPILSGTLAAMQHFAQERGITNAVTLFVASDNHIVREWFRGHISESWTVISPGKIVPPPESGVWFGQHGSQTNSILNQSQKDEAMAEAASDVFALGECDALYIPNYSSFSMLGITLMRSERRPVFFRVNGDRNYRLLPYLP
jgi:hypothetical protein